MRLCAYFGLGLPTGLRRTLSLPLTTNEIRRYLIGISRSQVALPVEHYLDRWSVIAAAALLAAVLHLVIVLFICGIDRKHRVQFLDAARPYSHANAALVVFSAAFLALTVLSGAQGDYRGLPR